MANLNDGLIGTADKQVILRINSKPTDDSARDVTVVPTADEAPLYYLAWVQKNIEAFGGDPNMVTIAGRLQKTYELGTLNKW